MITLVLAFVPLLYMSFCTYRSLLLIRLPFIRSFDMYSGRLTDAYALMKNAAYLCRLQFTLGVNFLRYAALVRARACHCAGRRVASPHFTVLSFSFSLSFSLSLSRSLSFSRSPSSLSLP